MLSAAVPNSNEVSSGQQVERHGGTHCKIHGRINGGGRSHGERRSVFFFPAGAVWFNNIGGGRSG